MVRKFFVLGLAGLLFSGAIAFGAEKIDALTWHSVQIYDVVALKKFADLQVGKIVGLRCHFRSKRIQRVKASWYEATLWQNNPQDRKKPFSYIRVKVARKDLPAFESLPSDFRGGPTVTIYGEVQKDAQSAFVRLIGRKVARDSARNATVSW
jgi:hypothetical protein